MVCPWGRNTCRYAAQYGLLDCLRYAHENGCPWDENTGVDIQLNMDVWIVYAMHEENGCPWDKNTCRYSANHGSFDCLRLCA